MDHQSPEQEASPFVRFVPVVGSVGVGLGMGLAATGEIVAGGAICGASALLLGLRLVFGRSRAAITAESPASSPDLIDHETGLPNATQLYELLRREIARSMRYGDRSALAVFDVRITGYQPEADQEPPPSPARYIATTMMQAARTSDIVARIDLTHFAVVLTECDFDGANLFSERLRTHLGTMPFAQRVDGKGVYVRAWSGTAHWSTAVTTPEEYMASALENLESTRRGYEAARTFFRGQKAAS